MNNHLLKTRSEQIEALTSQDCFDILVIGGGIHGASVARQAASLGLSVALLEKQDYASGTSSRSSKMAHGGLRYLEMGDFQQVFEGIKARERLFDDYPHLVEPYHFLIPIDKGRHFLRWKLKIGLLLYDFMVSNRERKHKWIARKDLQYEGFDSSRSDLEGCFRYTDGVLSDCRLVLENIHQARMQNACCLNYADVLHVSTPTNSEVAVSWQDTLSDRSYETKARLVINCAGPWATKLNHPSLESGHLSARYSQGTHLLFNRKWTGPALFLEMEGKARYYFVWPHFAGTMVGTTEREVSQLETDPQPEPSEVEEILERLARDLPQSNLNRETLHYAFAGVRTLPLRAGSVETGRLSRKHIWHLEDGMLSLVGGKLTTADWTAQEGVVKACQILGFPVPDKKLSRPNPSKDQLVIERLNSFDSLTEAQRARLKWRYGPRLLDVLIDSEDAKALDQHSIFGELRYALEYEQAETLEDVLRRRLELEYYSGCGVAALEKIAHELSQRLGSASVTSQLSDYSTRLEALFATLGKASPLDLQDDNRITFSIRQ